MKVNKFKRMVDHMKTEKLQAVVISEGLIKLSVVSVYNVQRHVRECNSIPKTVYTRKAPFIDFIFSPRVEIVRGEIMKVELLDYIKDVKLPAITKVRFFLYKKGEMIRLDLFSCKKHGIMTFTRRDRLESNTPEVHQSPFAIKLDGKPEIHNCKCAEIYPIAGSVSQEKPNRANISEASEIFKEKFINPLLNVSPAEAMMVNISASDGIRMSADGLSFICLGDVDIIEVPDYHSMSNLDINTRCESKNIDWKYKTRPERIEALINLHKIK